MNIFIGIMYNTKILYLILFIEYLEGLKLNVFLPLSCIYQECSLAKPCRFGGCFSGFCCHYSSKRSLKTRRFSPYKHIYIIRTNFKSSPVVKTTLSLLELTNLQKVQQCPNPIGQLCPNKMQPVGSCVQNQCGLGYTCINGLCCSAASLMPLCMDGTEAQACCLNGICGAGFVCSLGNLCCRRGDGTGNDLLGANNGFGTGNGGISGVTTSTASTTLFTTATSATTATTSTTATTTTTVNPVNCNGCDSRNINVNPSQGMGVNPAMLQPGNQNGCQTTTVTCHCQGQNTMCSIEVNNNPASIVTVGPPCDVTLTLTCSNGQWISQFGAVTSITCVGIIDMTAPRCNGGG